MFWKIDLFSLSGVGGDTYCIETLINNYPQPLQNLYQYKYSHINNEPRLCQRGMARKKKVCWHKIVTQLFLLNLTHWLS
jgi:hypothetical protein